jgi:GNAT superfamily N-acetyltransferase
VRYRIEALAGHERSGFASGSHALDRYFREQVTQDIRRRVATCLVGLDEANEVAGYYTLSSSSVGLNELPAEYARKLPRYPSVPATLMGRLAVAKTHTGRGLGSALLADALHRATHSGIATYALLVDPKDEGAARFYEHFGFERLTSARRMFHALGGIP